MIEEIKQPEGEHNFALDSMRFDGESFRMFYGEGEKIFGQQNEFDELYKRLCGLIGILHKLFNGDFAGKKIVDIGSGGEYFNGDLDPNAGRENRRSHYPPVLAKILHNLGADVLAIDRFMSSDSSRFPFNTLRLDFTENAWQEKIPANFKKSNVIISSSILGYQMHSSEKFNILEFIKKLSHITEYQVHAILEDDKEFLSDLTSENLCENGLKVIHNGLEQESLDDRIFRYLIIKNK
ncbi:MAG: hypothetical protein PHT51_04910 [Patescibacteria group bacterium]|nr:hypothetical protein [Patescibacteria group bacterium]MDD4610778.1 hypothetical protein [Patescibacteria group bacterium]